MKSEQKQQLRVFSPVILFHDQMTKDDTDAYINPFHHGDKVIQLHKRRISRMLEHNGRFWSDIIAWSRDHALATDHSPVPSLVSSPTPPLESRELPSPRQSPPPQRRQQSKNKTAGSATKTCLPSNKRRRGNLPKAVTTILRDWLSDHKKHPYPTEDEKATLATRTGLTLNQISNWFINARRRILQPMLEQQQEQDRQSEFLSYHSSDDSTDRPRRKRPATEPFLPQQKRINTRQRS